MSEPGGELSPLELSPLPEQPSDLRSRLARAPYLSLGVAALVVSTVFATVAALAGSRDERAAPEPEGRGAVESTTFDPTDPATTTALPGTPSSAPPEPGTTTVSGGTPTSASVAQVGDEETTAGNGGPAPNLPRPPGTTTTPRPPGTTQPPPTRPPVNQPPTAVLGGGCPPAGYDCEFTGGGSSDPEGGSLQYFWDFGDGTTSSAANPAHTFAAGTWDVTLTVTDNAGSSGTTTKQVTVIPPAAT